MPYFVPSDPGSGEIGTYNRVPTAFVFTTNPITWKWTHSTDVQVFPQSITLTVDGAPVATSGHVNGIYTFQFSASDGHHIAGAQGANGVVLDKPFLVNTTGARLPDSMQTPWTAPVRFERNQSASLGGLLTQGSAQTSYPGVVSPVYPKKPRTIEPYTTRLSQTNLWVRRLQTHIAINMLRTFEKVPPYDDVTITPNQKYFYADVTLAPIQTPPFELRDGPMGEGTLGFVYMGIISPEGTGVYYPDPLGRITFTRFSDGRTTTLAGWRNKPGIGASSAVRKLPNSSAPNPYYDDSWDLVGDWSNVSGIKKFQEPWQLATIVDPRAAGHHEFWQADTVANRILYLNHWTAHSSGYQQPLRPPVGYTAPTAPVGATQVVDFLTLEKLGMSAPGPLMNEPWGCAWGPDGKFYWSNFAEGTICRCNADGTGAEVFLQTKTKFTDGMLTIGQRLFYSTQTAAQLRELCHPGLAAGVYQAPGEYNIVRPQAMGFDSEGNLFWAERYTFTIRKCNMATREVMVFAYLPQPGGSSFGGFDIAMAIDTEGTCGPKDDIFTQGFHFTAYRYDKNGVKYPSPLITSSNDLVNGPLFDVEYPNYAWGIAIGGGRILDVGSAAGWQFIEITKRLPTDPIVDVTRYQNGLRAYTHGSTPSMALLHGAYGQGKLGLPTVDEMGSWDDDTLRAYGLAHGIPSVDVEDWIYWVRIMTVDNDYSTVTPQPDTLPPAAPENQLTPTFTWETNMSQYNIVLRGTAPVNPVAELNDIAAVRVYVNNEAPVSAPAIPGQQFEVTVTSLTSGPITVEHSFVDEVGNESARFSQQITVPDVATPMAPVEPLSLIAVTWVA